MRKKGVLIFMSVLAVACLCVTVASCDKNESYAEKLDNESKASNAYLSGFDVVNEIPADTIFEEGEGNRAWLSVTPLQAGKIKERIVSIVPSVPGK